jgi:uncharacterized LabA/DUF88 family protein
MSRVRLFVDFWNLILGVREYKTVYRIDWSKLPEVLVSEVAGEDQGSYEGACVYASINPKSSKDLKLKDFLSNTLNRMPGYEIKIFERKSKKNPTCQSCHSEITNCPSCESLIERTVEKGVDTAIVTDMLQHAWDDTYDIGVLLSGDRDFIPAVQFLNKRGKKIVHASFTNLGQELANECWQQINLQNFAHQLEYKPA